jgi:hypothetical protein
MTQQHQSVRLEALAGPLAEGADKLLGRSKPEDPFADVKDVEVGDLLPASVRDHPLYDDTARRIVAGSFGLSIIALLFGQGTVSAVVAGGSMVLKNAPTVGAYLSFVQAFFLTLALSVSATIFSYMTCKGLMRSYGAVGLWVIASVFIAGTLNAMGLGGPTLEAINTGLSHAPSNPIAQGLALMGVFLQYYTVGPFLGGLLTGGISGSILLRFDRYYNG